MSGLGQKLLFSTALMVGSTLLSRIIGYLRDVILAAKYGATADTQAYFAAFTLPDFLNYIMATGALSITFIPLFSRLMTQKGEDRGWTLFSVIISNLSPVLLLFIGLSELLAPVVVPLTVPGLASSQTTQVIALTRIVLPAQFFFFIGSILSAVLMVKQRFWVVALPPIVYNLSIILFGLLLSPLVGIAGFSYGVLLGSILGPFLIPFIALRREIRFRFRLDYLNPEFIEYIKFALPIMVGVSLITVDDWICKWFGSFLAVASIPWLSYAKRLMLVPISVFGQASGIASLPYLSQLAAENKKEEFGQLLMHSLYMVIFLTLSAAIFIIATAPSIVAFVYYRGRFYIHDVYETAEILVFFSIGIVFWGLQSIAARGFYALKNTLTPMIISTIATLCSLPVYALLVKRYQHQGLALASSFGMFLTALATLGFLRKRVPTVSLRQLAGFSSKVLVAGLIPGTLIAIVSQFFLPAKFLLSFFNNLIFLGVAGGIYLVLLHFGAILLKIDPYLDIKKRVSNKIRSILSKRKKG